MLILSLINLLFISCEKESFNIEINNNNNISTLYLLKNKTIVDSTKIESYYGKDKISKIKNNLYEIIFSKRCGSGCKTENVIIYKVIDNKLIETANFEYSYFESFFDRNLIKKSFLRKTEIVFKDSNIFLKKKYYINEKFYSEKNEILYFDKKDKIYFNNKINFNNELFKAIKIDSLDYIYYNKKWQNFNIKNGLIIK